MRWWRLRRRCAEAPERKSGLYGGSRVRDDGAVSSTSQRPQHSPAPARRPVAACTARGQGRGARGTGDAIAGVIATLALSLAACAEPAPRCPATPPPAAPDGPSSAEQRDAMQREDAAKVAAAEAKKELETLTLENKRLIEHTEQTKKVGSNGLVELAGGAGRYYLIEYTGDDCGGLPRHLMRIERLPGEWKWIGLACSTKFTEKSEEVGFECQGNNDKITARKTAWDTYEGVESRSPSTVLKGTKLASTCTGAWGVKATLVTHVPAPAK